MSEIHSLLIKAYLGLILSELTVRDQWISFGAWKALLYQRHSFEGVIDFSVGDRGSAIQTLMTWDKEHGRKGANIYCSTRKSCIIGRDDCGKPIQEFRRFVYVDCKSTNTGNPPYIPSTTRGLLPIFKELSLVIVWCAIDDLAVILHILAFWIDC
jgi:hypothetical protein